MKCHALSVILAAGIAAPAMAVPINIDLGDGFGTPSSTYGAAAPYVGFWNSINNPAAGFSMPLLDILGGPSGATWTNVTGNTLFSFDNPATFGGDQALMDDFFDLGGPGATDTFTITGLNNGSYGVIVYAWAPDSPSFLTGVSIPGGLLLGGDAVIGGGWPGGFVAGVTHAHFSVNVTNGTITINTSTVAGFSSLNGVQLIQGPPSPLISGLRAGAAAAPSKRPA